MHDSATTLWKLKRDDDIVACMVRLMPYGIEVDIVRGRTVALTRVFETDAEALAWAAQKREAREAQGWSPVPFSESDAAPVA